MTQAGMAISAELFGDPVRAGVRQHDAHEPGGRKMEVKVGDRIGVESKRVGQPMREGVILEVLSSASSIHYRVRWADGHESVFFPSAGSLSIIPGGEERQASSV
ncbi:MAG TPA: DUF1918 domain-containing protein [Candidatus Dormibacteraeota bacterium]|nr:DUF1918 domain-containing protein [Candidatus Dormibacteraeota bacterium]